MKPEISNPVPLDQATLHGDESIHTSIGIIELQDSYFDDDASRRLFDEMDYQRACQTYIWSMLLVSMTAWRNHQGKAYGVTKDTDFVVLESLKEKRGIVTGNLTTPYIFNFITLTSGPLEIKYPAGKTAGGVLDFWQRPVFDLGLTGPDKGQGATYIVVGPEDDPSKYKKDDVYVYQSATAPRGLTYWQVLADILSEEPVREIDKAWTAMLLPLGIAKGKPFQPDTRQKDILLKGVAMGELMIRNLQVNPRFAQVYWPGTHWYKSFDFHTEQETADRVELDERATWFYEAVSSTKGMVNPTPGAGQVYMTTKRDSQGRMLQADKNYKLHAPKDVPVKQFWTLTLYSENTRRPYDNGGTEIRSVNLDSRMNDLKHNADGSTDLYVGPEAPSGLESNHMKTVGDDGWFVYFRLYAPTEPFFEKTFALPDFVRLD